VLERDPAHLELDSFFIRFLSGVERTLAPADYALLLQLLPAGGASARAAYGRLAAAGRVDGFLLTDVEISDPRFELLESAGLPAVVAGRPVSASPFPWVETDHASGMAAAVEHLVDLGHRRVAFLGGLAEHEHVQARLGRWHHALTAARLRPGEVVHAGAGPGEAAAAAARTLDGGATAVACTSDVLAMAVVAAARERGLTVPGDVSVTGFDDSPLAALSHPPLTSVRVDYAEFGAAAAAALLAAIGREPTPGYDPPQAELIVRASTSPPSPPR
jgi:DNA-binding LacI/PurR family transcriptional regulator